MSSQITINRELDYHAFEAEGIIKAGTAAETFEFKVSGELTVSVANVQITVALAGLKLDSKLVAPAITMDMGPKFEMFNDVQLFSAQVKGDAFKNRAEVLENDIKAVLAEIENEAVAMRTALAEQSQAFVAVDASDLIAKS